MKSVLEYLNLTTGKKLTKEKECESYSNNSEKPIIPQIDSQSFDKNQNHENFIPYELNGKRVFN